MDLMKRTAAAKSPIIQAMSRRKTLLQAQSTVSASAAADEESSSLIAGDGDGSVGLCRTLTAVDLVLYGVGSSVGAGIYVLVGLGAQIAGPAITMSFLGCGFACILTSLAYAEFASRIPVAGSAFTYAYVAFGEFFAWLIGWNLILGYGFTASVISRAWADYTGDFILKLIRPYTTNTLWLELLTEWPISFNNGEYVYTFSLLSIVIVIVNTMILLRGVKDSANFCNLMTVLNISVLAIVVISALYTESVNVDNLTPFMPNHIPSVIQGAGLVFFAYIGFDMVASLSEETINPERNMPIGIVGSLAVSTLIYFIVSFVVVGIVPLTFLNKTDVPIVNSLLANACCTHEQQLQKDAIDVCLSHCMKGYYIKPILAVSSCIVAIGSIFGLMACAFTSIMGQPRIFYKMAIDGLFYEVFSKIDPTSQVPREGIIITGVVTAIVACFVPLDALANMISLGTLMVFTFVNAGVILLRIQAVSSPSSSTKTSKTTTPFISRLSKQVHDKKRQEEHHYSTAVYLLLAYTVALTVASILVANTNASEGSLISIIGLLVFSVIVVGIITYIPDTWSSSSPSSANSSPTEKRSFHSPGKDDNADGGTSTGGDSSSGGGTFVCPFVPAIPLAGIACNAFMMGSLPASSWLLIAIWMGFGIAVYFSYGIHNSSLGKMIAHGELNSLLTPMVGHNSNNNLYGSTGQQ